MIAGQLKISDAMIILHAFMDEALIHNRLDFTLSTETCDYIHVVVASMLTPPTHQN